MPTGPLRTGTVIVTLLGLLVSCAAPSKTASPTTATMATPSSTPRSAGVTVDSNPGGSPLMLAWQTSGAPGHPMQDPIHLAADPGGNIYVGSATLTGRVQVFDPNGQFLMAWGANGSGDGEFSFPLGIGIDANGNVFVADFDKVLVDKFDATGKFLISWPTEPPIGPAGVAVDGQGNVYVVNHRTHHHQVQKFDGNGKLLAQWGANGSGDGQIGAGASSGPEDLAVDQYGNVYVADRVNDRIEKFDTNGTFLATIGTQGSAGLGRLSGPGDVTVDGHGNIYVLDANGLQKFDSSGAFVTAWSRTGPLQDAGEVMADTRGNLYVNTDKIFEKFTQSSS